MPRVDAALDRRGSARNDEDRRAATALAESLSSVGQLQDLPEDPVVLKRLLARKVRQRLDGWGRLIKFDGVIAQPEGVLHLPDDPVWIKLLLAWETAAFHVIERNRMRFPALASRRRRKGRPLRESELSKLPPGRHSDNQGVGLMAVVRESRRDSSSRARVCPSLRWVVRLTCPWLQGTGVDPRRDFALGCWPAISLGQARAKALEYCRLVQAGKDPGKATAAPTVTVAELWPKALAERARKQKWKGGVRGKTGELYEGTFNRHLRSALGGRPVAAVTARDIVRVVKPLGDQYARVAPQAMIILHFLFEHAVWEEIRTDNPAVTAASRVGDLSSYKGGLRWVPVDGACAAYQAVCAYNPVDARSSGLVAKHALKTVILTAKRVGEVLQMDWSQIDRKEGVWRIPWENMKGPLSKPMRQRNAPSGPKLASDRREEADFFIEPLTPAVLEILDEMQALGSREGPVFQYEADGRCRTLPLESLPKLSVRLELPGTPHGWRKTIRTWMGGLGADKPDFEVAEMILAHKVGTSVSRLYDHAFFLAERRAVQERWARFLQTRSSSPSAAM